MSSCSTKMQSKDISFLYFLMQSVYLKKILVKNSGCSVSHLALSILSVCACHSWRPLHHRGWSVYSCLTGSSSITAALTAHFTDLLYFLSHCLELSTLSSFLIRSRALFSFFSCSSHVSHYWSTIYQKYFFFISSLFFTPSTFF